MVNAISWADQLACVSDPTKTNKVKLSLAGVKRILAHSTIKKEPITPEILAQLEDKLAGENADLGDLHIVTWGMPVS